MQYPRRHQPTPNQKRDPALVVQPRYWVRDAVVESVVPKYPELLASALKTGQRYCIQHALHLWAAGYHLNQGDKKRADELLSIAARLCPPQTLGGFLATATADSFASKMESDFPLTENDLRAIHNNLSEPEQIARDFVDRFSPEWFLGWGATGTHTMTTGIVAQTEIQPCPFSTCIAA